MFRVLVLTLALWVGGCGIVRQELDNRGGYVDYLADKYWWKADSKKTRALRAYALHAAIARIAMISPKGASERNQLAYQIGSAGAYAQQLVKCAYDNPGEPCFYFDSIMVDYVNALYTAAVAALPIEDAQKLISSITGGIVGAAGAVDILHALIQLGADAVRYGTVSAALYRDSLELEVQVWINSPNEPGSMVSPQDVAELAAIYATGRDNIPAWKAQIEALLAKGLEPTPNRRYLGRLFQLVSYACMQITTDETFRSKCIVNPGVSAAQLADLGPAPSSPGGGVVRRSGGNTTSGGGGNQVDSTNPNAAEIVQTKQTIQSRLKEIIENEQKKQKIKQTMEVSPDLKDQLTEQLSVFDNKIVALKEDVKTLQAKLATLQKK
ncbi:hypothetical protein [Bradyrhizobium sp. 930_D9_N1_4]|uniref:hypothetical protein n=1 Tax=Bradyrhizobium sp. 930_D9_N1_4 TaxID=3240374 RepID=UPI003F89F596